MTINEFLIAQGLNAEEIAAVVGNEKQAKAMSAALQRYEEGEAAKAKAAKSEQDTQTYWDSKTADLEKSVSRLTAAERRAAEAESEAARVKAYNKSLADAGYDVPKVMYEGATPTAKAEESKPFTREEASQMMRGTAPDLVTLVRLQAEYQDLIGSPYINIDQDFEEAKKSGKSLREYTRTKYNFDAKRTEKTQAAEKTRIDGLVAEQMKTKEAELAAKYGSNPNLSIPMDSKFARLEKQPGFKNNSWKSEQGRRENREARLKKFENMPLQ